MSEGELKNLITHSTRSAIQLEGKRKNYFEILHMNKENQYLIRSIERLLDRYPNLSLDRIFSVVHKFDPDFSEKLKAIGRVLDRRIFLLRGFYDEL